MSSRLVLVLLVAVSTVKCQAQDYRARAQCVIRKDTGAYGYPIEGTLYLEQMMGMVRITGTIYGFDTTDSYDVHGFHVHERGELSNGCKDAGGHYNPYSTDHGAPYMDQLNRHVGDLGNIYENGNSEISINITDWMIHLEGENNILGRAIVIHEKEDDLGVNKDDYGSTSTGNAGGRLGCCEITSVQTVSGQDTLLSNVWLLSFLALMLLQAF